MQNIQKSIHIVIFTGGLYPRAEVSETYWKNSLFGNPDYVIAADSGLEACLEYKKYFSGIYDFSPDKILGDFDSISSTVLLETFGNDIVETFPCDKDYTDTELALHFAYEKVSFEKNEINITLIGGDGGRLDHLLSILDSFKGRYFPHVWLTSCQQLLLLKKNQEYQLLGLKKDSVISFYNIYGKGNRIKTKGLKWESQFFKKRSMPSISNRISEEYSEKNEGIYIKPNALGFLLICPLDSWIIRN